MAERSLCAQTQAEALKYRLLAGLPVRRAAYAVIRSALEAGAKGCEVIVSGKLRQQRANAMKFKEGYMIKTGNACKEFVDEATRHVLVKQGMLGVKVRARRRLCPISSWCTSPRSSRCPPGSPTSPRRPRPRRRRRSCKGTTMGEATG